MNLCIQPESSSLMLSGLQETAVLSVAQRVFHESCMIHQNLLFREYMHILLPEACEDKEDCQQNPMLWI